MVRFLVVTIIGVVEVVLEITLEQLQDKAALAVVETAQKQVKLRKVEQQELAVEAEVCVETMRQLLEVVVLA